MFDIVIIGSGVAGLTAGIYSARSNKSVLIIEQNYLGGTTASLKDIENYPGFDKIDGFDLVQKMYEQCVKFGVNFEFDDIKAIDFDKNTLITDTNRIEYKTLIIASGTSPKRLNIANEDKYKLHGLSYCAVCDGSLYKNKKLVVFTKNNSALNSIKYLSSITNDLIVLDLSNGFDNPDYEHYSNVKPIEITGGDMRLSGVKCIVGISEKQIQCDGIFVDLGKETNIDLYKEKLANDGTFLLTDEIMHTNINNVFVAGDIRKKSLRQIITACSDGAIASSEAIKFLNNLHPKF
ncbi:MAG: FAD-dependent oxidoreductase [Firmicutes bacterium]|nr:FAD-dependent oxidoreductase [Bacillota bacterium]